MTLKKRNLSSLKSQDWAKLWYVNPAWQGVGIDDLQRSVPTLTILWLWPLLLGGRLMCYEQSDYLVSWKHCWVSPVIPVTTRKNLVLLVLEWVVSAFSSDYKLREWIGAVSLQKNEWGMWCWIVVLWLVEILKWKSLCYSICVWLNMKMILLGQFTFWSYQWNGIVAGLASAVHECEGRRWHLPAAASWVCLSQCAEAVPGSDSCWLPPPNPIIPITPISPDDRSFVSEMGKKKLTFVILQY